MNDKSEITFTDENEDAFLKDSEVRHFVDNIYSDPATKSLKR